MSLSEPSIGKGTIRTGKGYDCWAVPACTQTIYSKKRKTYTDYTRLNAPKFKLAKTAVDKAWKEPISHHELQSYTANKGIEWNFIVELAPWMGGFYDRLVGTVKGALKKSIGKICLTEEKLETFLAEAEAALILVHLVTSVRTSVLDFRIQQRTS